jgi:hypothetical protein
MLLRYSGFRRFRRFFPDFSTIGPIDRVSFAFRFFSGVHRMIIHVARPLFAWDQLEDSPSLATIRSLLDTIPDGPLLEGLRLARGRGRDDYPVHVLWGVVLLSIALRHVSTEACLAELRRNEALRRLIGIDSEAKVPKAWNVSRFLDVLGQDPHRTRLHEIFDTMVRRLGAAVEDLGRHTAGDSTGLSARRKPDKAAAAEARDGLPQASGGRKEYRDDAGAVTKILEWFGYKLHLLVDVRHEVALAYRITDTKTGDGETLPDLVRQAQANLPEGRIETLAYDKAADTTEVHRMLSKSRIKAVIRNRSMWQEEPERPLPGRHGRRNLVHDEAGTVYCYDTQSKPPVRHRMSYIGYEPERETLKYRCPARHEGWECPMSQACNGDRAYGLTVRVDREIDQRRFPALPRATQKFERLYKGRTAVERVNARLKIFWGMDDGNITGSRRFTAQMGAVMTVHAAFATVLAMSPRSDGTLGRMNLGPIAEALRRTAKS